MIGLIILGVSALGVAAMFTCFRIANWHSQESAYWYQVAALVNIDPESDKEYRPILMWCKDNKPSMRERVKGWESPKNRYDRAKWWTTSALT